MSKDIVRLEQAFWRPTPDRRARVMRTAVLYGCLSRLLAHQVTFAPTQWLPSLDWPSALFADEHPMFDRDGSHSMTTLDGASSA